MCPNKEAVWKIAWKSETARWERFLSRIAVEHLVKEFGDHAAVNDVSFSVERGALCVLLGPSGCGKSTTLRLIAGLEEPSSGRIEIEGRDVTHLPAKDRRIAMVFQSYALFPHLSVAQNIVFGLEVRRVPRAERETRMRKVAALTGLVPYLARKPGRALRRPAPARGARARHHQRAARLPDGRAALQPRRQAAP